VAFFAKTMGSQFETLELRIGHVITIVAESTFLDPHTFNIVTFISIGSFCMMAFITG